MPARHDLGDVRGRRGATAVFVVVSLVTLLGFGALALDMGMLYVARGELQVAADAAALAGASELLNEARLKGPGERMAVFAATRHKASVVAGLNPSMGTSPQVDLNDQNTLEGDVVLGHLVHLTNMGEQISLADPARFNTVLVRVRRDSTRNGPIALWFARVLGLEAADVVGEAAAAFHDGIEGYRVTDDTGPAELLPLALRDTPWDELMGTMAGDNTTYGDYYSYDPQTGQVTEGPDGIPELNLYPGAGVGQLPPGNFGTVDIGSADNSTQDISRQILEGISAEDLSYLGGQLSLADGAVDLSGSTDIMGILEPALLLEGDTGLSAAIKDELEAIIGRPRAVLLFDEVASPGNNAIYKIVRFAGIRIMSVKLTGPMDGKNLIIQPAFSVDDATIVGPAPSSDYVYHPVCLVR